MVKKKTKEKTIKKELEEVAREIYPILVKLREYDLKQKLNIRKNPNPQK